MPTPLEHPFRTRSEPGRLLGVLAVWHGRSLNKAAIARRLGVSRPTVTARLQSLEREGLVRLLPFFGAHRRPLLYLRTAQGSGLQDFRSLYVETIVTRLQEFLPESRCFWWHTGRVRRIDLLIETAQERIGICLCSRSWAGHREIIALKRGLQAGVIHRGFVLDPGGHAYFTARRVVGLPIDAFLREIEDWVMRRRTAAESLDVLLRVNWSEDPWIWQRSPHWGESAEHPQPRGPPR